MFVRSACTGAWKVLVVDWNQKRDAVVKDWADAEMCLCLLVSVILGGVISFCVFLYRDANTFFFGLLLQFSANQQGGKKQTEKYTNYK